MANENSGRKWIALDSQRIYSSSFFEVIEDKVQIPSGEIVTFTYVSRGPAVMAVPLLDRDHVILVRQYRHIVKQNCWEFPAGSVQEKETPEEAALRELEEETGYKARRLHLMNKYHTSNGTTDEILYAFVAEDLVKTQQDLDSTEIGMISQVFEISACLDMVLGGKITCAGTSLSFFNLLHYLNHVS